MLTNSWVYKIRTIDCKAMIVLCSKWYIHQPKQNSTLFPRNMSENIPRKKRREKKNKLYSTKKILQQQQSNDKNKDQHMSLGKT